MFGKTDTGSTVVDWSKVVNFGPEIYFKPKTKESLIKFLNNQHETLENIRVIGSLHSCSHINKSDCIIDVSGLPKEISFYDDNSRVKLSANWLIKDFLKEAGMKRKSLPATGGTNAQTLAGLISTNTAPATKHVSIYDGLISITYITLDSENKNFVEKTVTRSQKEFFSIVCSIGCIGIITEAEFELIDQPYYEVIQKVIPLEDVLGDIDKTSEEYNFWRINWLSGTKKGLFWGAKQIPFSPEIAEGDYKRDHTTCILDIVFKIINKLPSLDIGPIMTNIMKIMYDIVASVYKTNKASGPLQNMLPVDRHVDMRVAMAEWSFSPSSLGRVLEIYENYFKNSGWPTIPTEIELTKTDEYHMSPWNWKDESYIVKINIMYLSEVLSTKEKLIQMYDHIKGLWDALKKANIQFKAHWGKINFMDHQFVKGNFKLDSFLQLVNPIFVNEHLSKRLYDNPSSVVKQCEPNLGEEFLPENLYRVSNHIRTVPNSFFKSTEKTDVSYEEEKENKFYDRIYFGSDRERNQLEEGEQ